MRKHYPLDASGTENAGKLPWTDGVPSTGTEGSYPGHALFTDTEAEVLAAQDAAGFARNGSDTTQLAQAISRGIFVGTFGGSANALVFAIPNSVAFPTLLPGMAFRGIVATPNTGAVTVTPQGFTGSPGTLSVLRRDGQALQGNDLVAGTILDLQFDGQAFRIKAPVISEFISSQYITQIIQTIVNSGQVVVPRDAPTLYVRTDGNDGNDGSANDAAHAFATIGAALNKLRRQYAFSVATVQLGIPGTYASPQYVPTSAGVININGDFTNSANYIIQGAGSPGQGSLQVSSPVNLNGVTISNTGGQSHTVAATNGAQLALTNVNLITTGTTTGYHAFGSGGRVVFAAGCTISGNAGVAMYGDGGGEAAINPSTTLTVSGNPTFSLAFAVAVSSGRVTAFAGSSISGAATGQRYNVQNYGVINTNGGGPNFFSGTAAGYANNGLYL